MSETHVKSLQWLSIPLRAKASLDQGLWVLTPYHLSDIVSYVFPYTRCASGTRAPFMFHNHADQLPIFRALHVLFFHPRGHSCIQFHGPSFPLHTSPITFYLITHLCSFPLHLPPQDKCVYFASLFRFLEYKIFESKNLMSFSHCNIFSSSAWDMISTQLIFI